MSIRTALLALTLCLLPAAAHADEAEAERARGRALVAGLSGVDPALLGTYHFAYDQQGKNVGFKEVTVERAPEGSGAAYKVTIRVEGGLEGVGSEKVDEEALLDERLALVSYGQRLEREFAMMGETVSIRRELRVQRRSGEWVAEQVEKGKQKQTARLKTEAPEYGYEASWLLLARKLDLVAGGKLRLPTIYFAFDEDEESSVEDVTIGVGPARPFMLGGREVTAHLIEVEADLRNKVLVTPEHALVAHWVGPERTQDRYVAVASAEEARKDLEAEDTSPEAQEARRVALAWFEVMAGERPVEALDDVVDWTALRDQEAERRPAAVAQPA